MKELHLSNSEPFIDDLLNLQQNLFLWVMNFFIQDIIYFLKKYLSL